MEKLNLGSDKIIHILLKHLMFLKNENEFLKKNATLYSLEKGIQESNLGAIKLKEGTAEGMIGAIKLKEGIPEGMIGANQFKEGIPESMVGANQFKEGIPESLVGANQFKEGIPESMVGANQFKEGIPESMVGANQFKEGIPEVMVGANQFKEGIVENMVGAIQLKESLPNDSIIPNHIFSVVQSLNDDRNKEELLCSVFEQGLLKSLDEFIKSDDGQKTLYKFYDDFKEALEGHNSDASKIKEAAKNPLLEDTHFLPEKLSFDRALILDLSYDLRGILPRKVIWRTYEKVANELVHLHNSEMATSAELRGFSAMSVGGFRKHLTKLLKYGLIKYQAPSNYVLTEKSIHLLLKQFGIPKAV